MPILPSEVPTGKITGNLAFVSEDTWDVDTKPELTIPVGTVTFTASVETLRMPTYETILLPLTFEAVLDFEGNLVPKYGTGIGIDLPATNSPFISEQDFTYRVDFALQDAYTGKPFKMKSFNIQVPVGTTKDLSSLIPLDESGGVITLQGSPGKPGLAATVTVGTTTTGNPGTNATVTQAGTEQARVLNFTIPRGAVGETGPGVPAGGTALQLLRKNTGNTTTEWTTPTKSLVGLGNVDNTSDNSKPVSAATATALDLKADKTYVDSSFTSRVTPLESAQVAQNKVFTTEVIPATATVPTYTLTKIHNAIGSKESLKKYVAFGSDIAAPPVRETLDGFYKRTGAVGIYSASGFWQSGEDNNKLMGLSILNGQILKGWDTGTSDLGKEAIVMMRDGTLKCYSNATTPEQVIADGGWNSWSWGAAMYKDGAITNFQSIWRYRDEYIGGKQMFGDLMDGTIIFMTFPGQSDVSGPNAKMILEAVAASGMQVKNLYFLDAGGTAQSMVNGEYIVPSSDPQPRPVGDVIAFNAVTSTKQGRNTNGWVPYALQAGLVSNGPIVPAYKVQNGVLYSRGSIKPTTGAFALTSTVQLTIADSSLLKIEPTDALVVATGALDSPFARLWIQGGRINLRTPSTALSYVGIAPLSGILLDN